MLTVIIIYLLSLCILTGFTYSSKRSIIDTGSKYIGMVEGVKINEEIYKFTGLDIDTRSTAWCAAFVGMVLSESGYPLKKTLRARDFLTYGKHATNPKKGDIVVLTRTSNPNKGHVGFYMYENEVYVFLLGGNQDNMVKVKAYLKSRIIDIRRA